MNRKPRTHAARISSKSQLIYHGARLGVAVAVKLKITKNVQEIINRLLMMGKSIRYIPRLVNAAQK